MGESSPNDGAPPRRQRSDELLAERSFEALFAAHSTHVRNTLKKYSRDADQRDDLFQMVWLSANKNFTNFRGSTVGSFVTWLDRLCRTESYRLRRSVWHEVVEGAAMAELIEAAQDVDGAAILETLIAHETYIQLLDLILELPPRQRDTVVFRAVAGRSIRDTASAMGCKSGTVNAAYRAGVIALQQLWMEHNARSDDRHGSSGCDCGH